MASTFLELTNEVLVRLNEVTLPVTGDGFTSVRNVQALAKQAVNNSVRNILQTGQEWPFLKTTVTQNTAAGQSLYDFTADYSVADWETFYLTKSDINSPLSLSSITYSDYVQRYRTMDDNGPTTGIASPSLVYQTNERKFGLTPTPNAIYTIEYVYWFFPADLIDYNDTVVIPDRFKHVIVDGAMMYMMRFRSNDQSAAMHQDNLNKGIKLMQRVLTDDTLRVRSTVISNTSSSNQILGRVS